MHIYIEIRLKADLPSCFDSVKGCNIYRFKIIGDETEIEAEFFRSLRTISCAKWQNNGIAVLLSE